MSDTAINRPTKKQRELLTFVENFISGHGYGPSYREIRAGMGYNSVATVALHIDNLILKGYLKKGDNKARSLEIADKSVEEKFRSNVVKSSDEKWLVEKVEHYFVQAELSAKPKKSEVDNLYVLVGSLKVLGLDGAANSFLPRLKQLKKKL